MNRLSVVMALLALAVPARAGASTFALVVGVNRGVDRDAVLLRFADDDAARFHDLFRAAGATTFVLSRLDENTRRLHPDVAAEASPPTLAALGETVSRLAAAVAADRAAGRRTVLYLAYAGHGTAEGDGATISLEDAQLSGADLLERIIDPVGADQTHVIVDACQSYFLVLDRGPGGSRRPLQGYALGALARRPDIGLLLSTSSARESHEWAAFQAGVFSHEVRSGLYGAADADGDGRISYVEIASFVERANAAVPNERYRPDIFARAPTGETTLLDLRAALTNRIEIDGPASGHHFIEDTAGVRWLDFHGARPVRLVRPGRGRLYLRRPQDDREYVLPEGAPVLRTSQLPLVDAHVASRGAANDAFLALFSLPFGADSVAAYGHRDADLVETPAPARSWRSSAGTGLTVAGAAAVIAGGVVLLSARNLHGEVQAGTPQRTVEETNAKVSSRQRTAAVLMGAGGAAVAGGLLLWLWPGSPAAVSVSPDGAAVALRRSF